MFRELTLLLAAPLALSAQQPQQPQTQQVADTTFHSISLADAIRLANDKNVSNIIVMACSKAVLSPRCGNASCAS